MRRARGFTLIEIMISVAILAMVTTLVWGSFKQTFKTKTAVEAQSSRYRTVRVGLQRLARELSMAYISQNEDTSQPERRTLFVGKHSMGGDNVRFSYFGHQRLYQDANEADTAQVEYFTARNPDDSRKTDLLRRETRRLANYKPTDQPNEVDVVTDDIVSFKLDYWDQRDKQWREEWVTNSADGQPDRLPGRIRITLTVHDERGKEVPFSTEVRVPMQEPLQSRAVDAQTQAGGTTGGTGGTAGAAKPTTGTTTTPSNPLAPGATPR
jgi:general secretion pathway protein J